MNLMFRKNFREGGSGGSKPSGTKMNKMGRSGKRSRDLSYSGPSTEESFTQYRTHLFFNANRSGAQDDNGGLSNIFPFKTLDFMCVVDFLRSILNQNEKNM